MVTPWSVTIVLLCMHLFRTPQRYTLWPDASHWKQQTDEIMRWSNTGLKHFFLCFVVKMMKFNAMQGSAESNLAQHNKKCSAEAWCRLPFFFVIMLFTVILVMSHNNMVVWLKLITPSISWFRKIPVMLKRVINASNWCSMKNTSAGDVCSTVLCKLIASQINTAWRGAVRWKWQA